MRFNYSKLLGRIKEYGFTQAQLAKAIGISKYTLNGKLNNKYNFDAEEMLAIGKVLNISLDEFGEYFFAV